ncbi:MAG: ribosome maturation factor RimP [Campylobacterota bacterium]|nr:ribosome maturation factor RimP [Campylobacterota bacterium]
MTLEESIKMTVEGLDLYLYDIVTTREHDRNIFRVYITGKDGVSLDQCAHVSRLISPILDIDEPMNGVYTLEVSSPGIERKLKVLDHFKASVGELVKIKDIANEKFKGKLLKVEGSNVFVDTKFGEEKVDFDFIESAKTYFEW